MASKISRLTNIVSGRPQPLTTVHKLGIPRTQFYAWLNKDDCPVVLYNNMLYLKAHLIQVKYVKSYRQRYGNKQPEFINANMRQRLMEASATMFQITTPQPGDYASFSETAVGLESMQELAAHLVIWTTQFLGKPQFNPDDYLEMFT